MSEFTPKSERLGRLITNAPEMYKLLKDLAAELRAYGYDVTEYLYSLMTEAEKLLARIDGEEHEELHEVEAQA